MDLTHATFDMISLALGAMALGIYKRNYFVFLGVFLVGSAFLPWPA